MTPTPTSSSSDRRSRRPELVAAGPISPWSLDRHQLEAYLPGEPQYRLSQIWEGLYQHGLAPSQITTLPRKLRDKLSQDVGPRLSLATTSSSEDDTVKWLFALPDDASIETVLMHYTERSTVCVSSQAGCAMGCGFCATGQSGFRRNLSAGEILEQVVAATNAARPRRLSNVVFMGMGEPLANYDRVLEAVRRLISDFGIGARRITISTIGLVPQMKRLASESLQVGLAVSLHAANDQLRNHLVPINLRHPLAEVVEASRMFRHQTGRRVSFEWAMIDEINDSNEDAHQLSQLAHQAKAHINLIPLNPTPGWPTKGSGPRRIKAFAAILSEAGVNVTIRANRGTDIAAACGQLSTQQSVKIGRPND